jgi:1,4-alpha-glucan branching enzyme
MNSTLHEDAVKAIVYGMHGTPFDVLGMHDLRPQQAALVIRTFQPFAERVELVESEATHVMQRIHKDGLFELVIADRKRFPYRLKMTDSQGHSWMADDPYGLPVRLTDFDLHLIGEGTHYRTYEKLGAHLLTVEGLTGVHFAVWAPNAIRVSVIGQFNRWNGLHHPMQRRSESGIWELFIPGLVEGRHLQI